jgi:SAM-dependent methyltransferase
MSERPTTDWSRTSVEYAKFRSRPPESLIRRLVNRGIGQQGQKILDIGTGTGAMALAMAQQGAHVAGIDSSEGQIEQAKRLAEEQNLEIDYQVGTAEALPWDDNSFDVVTALQSWRYFYYMELLPELRRVLNPGGKLVTAHVNWLPSKSRIVRATEELILEFNPYWDLSGWKGVVKERPRWSRGGTTILDHLCYDEAITFTHEEWVGRIRTSKGVGAQLDDEDREEFTEELVKLLKELAPETFEVQHRIDFHIYSLEVS